MRGLMTGLLTLGMGLMTLACAMPLTPGHPGVFTASCDVDRRLRVMTVHADTWGDGTLLDAVQQVDPDVLLLTTDDDLSTPLHRLDTRFPHATRHITERGAGVRIYAHHPIDQPEPLPDGTYDRAALQANLVLPTGDTVQLLGTGPSSRPVDPAHDWLATADRAGRRDVPTVVLHAATTTELHVGHRGAIRSLDAENATDHLDLCVTAPRGSVALPTRAHRDAAQATLVALGRR